MEKEISAELIGRPVGYEGVLGGMDNEIELTCASTVASDEPSTVDRRNQTMVGLGQSQLIRVH